MTETEIRTEPTLYKRISLSVTERLKMNGEIKLNLKIKRRKIYTNKETHNHRNKIRKIKIDT